MNKMTKKDREMITRMFILIMRGIFILVIGNQKHLRDKLQEDYYKMVNDLYDWSSE